jgi:hypothetical protein
METTQNPTEIKEIQEIAISISATNFSPTIINPDYLKISGVIPQDWQLSREPIASPGSIQLVYQNRISIVGQQNMVTFIENIGTEQVTDLIVTELAKKFIEKLPNADYQFLNFNPKSVIPMKDGGSDAARRYITGTLLAPGSWQDIGKAPMQANLNLSYQLDRCQLNVSINEANIQIPEQPPMPGVLFSGNFNYNVSREDPSMRLTQLHKCIEHWDLDLAVFREMIEQRFLIFSNSIFPASFNMG